MSGVAQTPPISISQDCCMPFQLRRAIANGRVTKLDTAAAENARVRAIFHRENIGNDLPLHFWTRVRRRLESGVHRSRMMSFATTASTSHLL